MDTIASRFNKIVADFPNQLALVSDDEQINYRQLGERTKCIANLIIVWFQEHRSRDVKTTDVIGVSFDKSIDLYVAILAAIGIGSSYVPIDPDLDEESKQHIINTCKCELIIMADEFRENVFDPEIKHMSMDNKYPEVQMDPSQYWARCIATDIAYTIFTSGTTGKPKGVMVNHANILNLVDWAIKQFKMNDKSKVLQFSTINFDASILDIFPTLLVGATLYIPTNSQRMSIIALTEFCGKWQVNQAFLPPSLLNILNPEEFSFISTVLTGGEPCTPTAIGSWSQGRLLYNLYGPTECTVLASYKLMDANTNPKNIGNVIEGVRAYILDDNQMQAEEGELYLAGVAVTCGYKNNTQSTQAKFLKLPHLDSSEIYRTGDIVKLNTHKEIIFMGRSDRQVKIRGYRVELEEIEGAFLAAGCKEVAVIQSKELALIAYVVIDETIGLEMLKVELTNRLSSYKLPKHIIKLESLPYKNNCKVDYQALPDVLKPGAGEIKYEALSGAHELIAKLWSEVLSINIELLNHQSNFRTLGGDSINIAMLLAGVEEKFGVVVDYVDFFDNPTIGFLFEIVKNKESELC